MRRRPPLREGLPMCETSRRRSLTDERFIRLSAALRRCPAANIDTDVIMPWAAFLKGIDRPRGSPWAFFTTFASTKAVRCGRFHPQPRGYGGDPLFCSSGRISAAVRRVNMRWGCFNMASAVSSVLLWRDLR